VDSLVEELRDYGVTCTGHDPHASSEAAAEEFGIEVVDDPDFADYDGVVVATGHDEYHDLDLADLADDLGPEPVVLDVGDVFDADRAASLGYHYREL
jgi:UDP-N-acetyl-D-galactosamine dehydrogenase